jgi:hypothetical protein
MKVGSVHVLIGGPIAHGLVNSLAVALADTNLSLECGRGRFAPRTAVDLLEAADPATGILRLVKPDAEWGAVEALERLMVEGGIAFDRITALNPPIEGEVMRYRPGLGRATWLATSEGHETIALDEAKLARNLLAEALQTGSAALLRRGLSLLDDVLGPEMPRLKALVIDGLASVHRCAPSALC